MQLLSQLCEIPCHFWTFKLPFDAWIMHFKLVMKQFGRVRPVSFTTLFSSLFWHLTFSNNDKIGNLFLHISLISSDIIFNWLQKNYTSNYLTLWSLFHFTKAVPHHPLFLLYMLEYELFSWAPDCRCAMIFFWPIFWTTVLDRPSFHFNGTSRCEMK